MVHFNVLRGGQFLTADVHPEEIFTPEDFTMEQRLVGKSAEEFAFGELVPRMDEFEPLNSDLLKSLMRKVGNLGFLSMDIPEDYGGSSMDMVSSALVTERIHQGVSSFMLVYVMQTGVGSLPILLFGTPEQKQKYLPKLGSGETIGTYALTEPNHGSDALGAETTAVLSEDGRYYVLNGQKQFSSNSGFTDVMSTYAQVDGTLFTAFIVERDWQGISLGEEELKMGLHGSSTRSIFFQDVKVPVENVLGEIGKGHVVALTALSIGRFKLGAMAVGWAKALIAEAVKHAKSRIQFGKPICEFGLVQHKIAEMVIRTYVAESMVYRTAHLLDLTLEGIGPEPEEASVMIGEALREYAIEGSINKIFGTELLDYVADESVQIMGGYGYIQGNLIERSYRDSRINRIWEGTNEINRLLIVNTLLKCATEGKLSLFNAVKEVENQILRNRPEAFEDHTILEAQQNSVMIAKKITLVTTYMAIEKYKDGLRDEQEVSALIADMTIQVYAIESALLRALKGIERKGEDKSRMHIAATLVYINDTLPKVFLMANQVLAAVCEGEQLKDHLLAWERFTHFLPINTIPFRRQIAERVLKVARYPLSQL
jgi:alkylation response protein AidB-like acyl-CoA dehydrogenase